MTLTDHYSTSDPLIPPEVAEAPPERDDYDGHFVTDLPSSPAPAPHVAIPLETILCALRSLVVATREVQADDWAPWYINLAGEANVAIANRQPGRRELIVRNLNAGGGATAYIGARPNMSQLGASWRLAPGESVTIKSGGAVYAMTDPAATVLLNVLAQFDTTVVDPF